ncbi:hypothetical protein [uncultured Kordia sp.]|uniref:hypothetical protein n=1 Tax=uncultured Kordia sp. TaxID=507699 RepID=UPI00262A9A01|nr:hypothetical protein [uncultured Kordia sp.]
MKKKNLKTMHLKKRLIANMVTNQVDAMKGGTRTQFNSVELTICPGQLYCQFNTSE